MTKKDKWLKLGDRQVIRTEDLDDETLEAILNAEVPEEAKRLNYLMEDSTVDWRPVVRLPNGLGQDADTKIA